MDTILILPNQLFEQKLIPENIKNIYIYEHNHYFNAYNYNKKKLMLHKASIEYYKKYLDLRKHNLLSEKPEKYVMFESADKLSLLNLNPIKTFPNPNFLLNKSEHEEYNKNSNTFKFYPFYMHFKKKLGYLPKEKSYDKQNRKSLPKNIDIPNIPSNKSDSKWINIAKKYVDENYKKNYGNTNNFIFPISHKTAKMWLNDFLEKRFNNFGKYQDAIDKDNCYLFHSILSTSINIGLLNPKDIIDKILELKNTIAMNNIEGFIRQLFWREYQRYCYNYLDFNDSFFNNTKKIKKEWYDGTLGILPIDNSIKRAFDTGYLHHIERLMVIGNYMNISEINEKDGYKWFMEFSCDSYEWVMHQNVLDMVFFVTGGKTTRKPYVSSSNYIKKMSNYKGGEWEEKWDKLYDNFLKKHKKKLYKFRYYFNWLYK